jgi:serine protease Do
MTRCAKAMPIAVLIIAMAAQRTPVSASGAAQNDRGFDPAIETVSTRVVKLFGLKAGLSAGYGAGTLISGDGLVVTTFSLLLDSRNLRAVTHDGTVYGADVLDLNEDLQLALLKLNPKAQYDRRGNRVEGADLTPDSLEFFEPGDSRSLLPGDWVIAAGNPFKVSQGAEPISVTIGVFSARTHLDARRKTRDFPYTGDVLVIDAITSNPGAPGGPLLNLDGQWVGVIGRVVVSRRTHTNFNYALPVETVMDYVRSVLDADDDSPATETAAVEPYHGIKLFDMGYQKNLVYVDRVSRRSPAKTAGLRKDDLIVSIDGRSVRDAESFHEIMRTLTPGKEVELIIIRDEKLFNKTLIPEDPRQ